MEREREGEREPEPEGARLSYGPSHEVCVILFWFELSGRATKQKWPFTSPSVSSICEQHAHLRGVCTALHFFFFSPNVDELIADRRFVETFGHCLVVLSCTACQYMRMYVIHVHVVDQQLGSIPEPECGVR